MKDRVYSRIVCTVVVSALSTVLWSGCTHTPDRQANASTAQGPIGNQDDQAALARRAVEEFVSSSNQVPIAYKQLFISIGVQGEDPAQRLLDELHESGIGALPLSAATLSNGRLIHSATGKPGKNLNIGRIDITNERRALVWMSHLGPDIGDVREAIAFIYTFEKIEGRWIRS